MATRRETTRPRGAPTRRGSGEMLAERVGARLRARRAELDRTLKDVAKEAEVSVSYLSAVEKGASVPSLPVLARVVHVLGLAIADVLGEAGRDLVRREHLDDDPGVAQISHDDLQLDIAHVVANGGQAGESPVASAGRDVLVHLRSGTLTVSVDGDEHVLRSGDSLDAVEPEAITWTAGEDGAVSVWAAGVPRQRGVGT